MEELIQKQVLRDLPNILKPTNAICKSCQIGKQVRVSFKTKENSLAKPLQLVHIELFGPSRNETLSVEQLVILIIDDYTRMTWVAFFKEKYEASRQFKVFKALTESQSYCKLKCLRFVRDGEFTTIEFDDLCEEHGIGRQLQL